MGEAGRGGCSFPCFGGDAAPVGVWLPITPAALLTLPLPIFVTRALGNLPVKIKSFSFKSTFSG